DIGVHQDGLVHLSEISHTFIKEPAAALSVGQVVKVKVMGVDLVTKRIALSIKALLPAPAGAQRPRPEHRAERPERRPEAPRGPRPEARGPRPEARGPRPDGPRGPRPEGPRSPRPEGRGGRPEGRPHQGGGTFGPKAEPAKSGASLGDLMAKFGKGPK
ncbi:MAG TPA: S1 RNA-binding domain-containing protein, partial [Holophagaceae bacterium]|nr:S1 RNA-binding domain-containing protein [Holophagaceae bacterium]